MKVLYITPAGRGDSTLPALESSFPELEWSVAAPEEDLQNRRNGRPELVVVSPETPDPVDLVRPLRNLRGSQLLFLREGDDESLASRLTMQPGIAGRAQVRSAADRENTIETIRKLVQTIESRQQLRTTLDRMNLRLADSYDPTQMRKMALSDEYLAAILSSAADAILSLDESGVVTSANKAAERMFGRERKDLIRQKFDRLLAAEDRAKFHAVIEKSDRDRSERLRLRFSSSEDSVCTTDVTLSWFGGSERVPASISVIARDVSREQREREEKRLLADASAVLFSSLEMRESLNRLSALLLREWVDVCLIDLVQGDRMDRVSAAARDSIGHDAGTLLPYGDVMNDEEHPGAEPLREQEVLLQREVDPAFFERFALDSESRATLSSLGLRSMIIAPLVVHGRSIGLLTAMSVRRQLDDLDVRLASEIAQRTAIAFDNARLYEDAVEASRLKDEFLATLSHELRTPMTAILGWVRMLDLGDLDEETYREAITTIRRSAKAQASLIDDILDVSRITLGKLKLDVGQIDPSDLVQVAVDTTSAAAEAKRIRLSVEIEPDIPMIRGDASRLQQVIWNLLSNAVKFTPKGGSIVVGCDTEGSWVRIRVTDTGEGIPQADVPYVFDRFRQVDSSSTRIHGGLGLGLSIVKQIVELHGGEVSARSAGAGEGSTFTVLLPVASVAEGTSEGDEAPRRYADDDEMELYSLAHQSILVVDDHEDARRLVETVLDQAGAEVVSANSARKALELIEARDFSVIVSDIAMPDEDGFRFLEQIQKQEEQRGKSFCVIALTAFGGVAIEEKMRAAGFDAYLRKPVDPVALTRTIHDLLELDRSMPAHKHD